MLVVEFPLLLNAQPYAIFVSLSSYDHQSYWLKVSEQASVLLESSVAISCTFCGLHYIESTKITSLDSYVCANVIFDIIDKSRPNMMYVCSDSLIPRPSL